MFGLARGLSALALIACVLPTAAARAQLSADEELKTLKASPEIEVSVFASEPLITNPAAIDVDTHGRVWVAEIQFYRGGAKQPPADKIKVLEDTDGDGRADKVTVFAEGLFAPMSVCVAGSKVFVATSPDLWMFEDNNGDLVADGPPKKLLTGFGGHNHDHGAHSLTLGPDHKWWMSHGDEGFDVTGTDGSHIKYERGAVLRGELDGSRLETVAVNFRNPYEVCVDSFGEAFLSDNDNDGNESVRICWILEGGNYGWFGRPPFGKQELDSQVAPGTPYREAWHFRGFIPGFVPGTLVTGFGSPTGMCIYESELFGPTFANAPLHTDCGPRECRAYQHRPHGYGMAATSEVFLSNEGDNYFRPDDICVRPDGALYVSDWYDGGVGGHGYNNPDQGRIFLLKPKGKELKRREKPGPYETIADAIEGLKSPNLATQYLARERLLAGGAPSEAALVALLDAEEPNERARALWLLDRLGDGVVRSDGPRRHVLAQLKSVDPAMRALAVRILRRHGERYGDEMLSLSGDSSDEVKREVLLAIRKVNGAAALAVLARMAATYDGSDRYQLEAIHVAAEGRKQELLDRMEADGPLSAAQFPLVQVLSPDRAAALVLARLKDASLEDAEVLAMIDAAAQLNSLGAGWGLLEVAAQADRSQDVRRAALDKVVSNLGRGGDWSPMVEDPRLREHFEQLLADKAFQGAALRAIRELRLHPLGAHVLALSQDAAMSTGLRCTAIAVVARLQPEGAIEALRTMLTDQDPKVAATALNGLVDVQDATSLRQVLADDKCAMEKRRGACDRLMESTPGAILLVRLLEEERLCDELKQLVVAKATTHPDANVRVLYEKFIPEEHRPKKLGSEVSAEEILKLQADANRGRSIFFQSSAAQCNRCHAVQGFGSDLGPELSNIGKKYERAALLETILLPSKAISHEYRPYLLETTGGQVYAGFLVEKTDQHVVLRDVNRQQVRVPAAEVESLIEQEKSLMPELILSEITAQDAADLLAFLESCK